MADPITLLGLGSAALASVTGYKAVRYTLDLAAVQPGTSGSLKRAYDEVLDEPVPDDMTRLLDSLGERQERSQ